MSHQAILDAARKQAHTTLKHILKTSCIDVSEPGKYFYSAASRLASEQDKESVDFLIQYGANLNFIAQGAARGGHRAYAEELCAQGASINWLARGAAQGGHRAYAEELRAQGACIKWIVMSAAISGHLAYAEELRLQANTHFIAWGAAVGGHRVYAEELRARGASIDWLAMGAAHGGHRAYAEELRAQGASVNWLANGAAEGGHRAYAEELRAQGASINFIAQGAAQGGHRAYAEELRTQANINEIARSAAIGGHRAYAEELRAQGACINWIVTGAAIARHPAYAEELRAQGANINEIALGAELGGNLNNEKSVFIYLMDFKESAVRNEMIAAILNHDNIPEVSKQITRAAQNRCSHVLSFKNEYQISIQQAIALQAHHTEGNYKNFRAIHYFCQWGQAERVKRAVENGANLTDTVDVADSGKNITPIQIAASKGHWEIVSAIAKAKKASEGDPECYGYALLLAAKNKEWATCTQLLEAGASLHWRFINSEDRGNYAIHFFERYKEQELVMAAKCKGGLQPDVELAPTPENIHQDPFRTSLTGVYLDLEHRALPICPGSTMVADIDTDTVTPLAYLRKIIAKARISNKDIEVFNGWRSRIESKVLHYSDSNGIPTQYLTFIISIIKLIGFVKNSRFSFSSVFSIKDIQIKNFLNIAFRDFFEGGEFSQTSINELKKHFKEYPPSNEDLSISERVLPLICFPKQPPETNKILYHGFSMSQPKNFPAEAEQELLALLQGSHCGTKRCEVMTQEKYSLKATLIVNPSIKYRLFYNLQTQGLSPPKITLPEGLAAHLNGLDLFDCNHPFVTMQRFVIYLEQIVRALSMNKGTILGNFMPITDPEVYPLPVFKNPAGDLLMFGFHGTSSKNSEKISETSFQNQKSVRQLYGSGSYMAIQLCKSLQYTSDQEACVLLCAAFLGKNPYFKKTSGGCKDGNVPKYNAVVAVPEWSNIKTQEHFEFVIREESSVVPILNINLFNDVPKFIQNSSEPADTCYMM